MLTNGTQYDIIQLFFFLCKEEERKKNSKFDRENKIYELKEREKVSND